MAARIESAPVRYPFSFVVAGDSGAWPDPTAEAIYAQLLRQTAELEPVFFANLGDFAGPGTHERHEEYLRGVEALPVPNLCVIGNHDLDDPSGPEAWAEIHGPRNFDFAYGHTRFIALDAAPWRGGGGRHRGARRGTPGRATDGAGVPRRAAGGGRGAAQDRAHALPAGLRRAFRATSPSGASTIGEREFLDARCASTRWRSSAARTRSLFDHHVQRRHALPDHGRRRERAVLALPRRLRGGRGPARGSRRSSTTRSRSRSARRGRSPAACTRRSAGARITF